MSLPPGFRARNPTLDDAGRATEVIRAFELDGLGRAETTVEDVKEWWRELDPETDVWLVDDPDGRTVAYAAVVMENDEVAEADGYVVPHVHGRGLGRYLVNATEDRSRARGAHMLHNGVLERDASARSLLESAGYSLARRFAEMLIDLTDEPAVAAPPAGVAVRTFRPGLDEHAFHHALQEFFADHWGFVSEPYKRWHELNVASVRFDPRLWFIAEENDSIVGVARCTWKQNDLGWVNDLAVHREARRRGVALALLTTAFAEFYRRGERRVGLGVDTRNETGATRLYERAGMQAAYTSLIYEKALA
jgi:mycothiol synthase